MPDVKKQPWLPFRVFRIPVYSLCGFLFFNRNLFVRGLPEHVKKDSGKKLCGLFQNSKFFVIKTGSKTSRALEPSFHYILQRLALSVNPFGRLPAPNPAFRRRILLGLLDVVFPPEPFYAARRVNELLFAGKKRMTGGTNFHLNVLYGRTGPDNVPAGAGYRRFFISGMNLVSHNNPLNM
jgi:hypothetical protein